MEKPFFNESVKKAASLLLKGSVTLSFDQLDFHQHHVPFKKRVNFFIQGIQLIRRSVHRIGIPPILQTEPSNICNLHCLTCATGAGLITRPEALMSYNLFQRIIDQVQDYVFLLVFWSWGEPFLNKDAFRMIRYAKDKGLLVHTSTNGHFINSRKEARKVIDSGLDSLIVAVDGLDQQTYEKYRKGGNFQKVINSIENLVNERTTLGVSHPRITLRFMVMKHNEHQVGQVKEFAQNLGVDVVSFRSAVMRRSGIDFEDRLMPRSSDFHRFNYKRVSTNAKCGKQLNNYCHRPYANLTIFSNGDVVTCENDYNATYQLGNITEQSLKNILASDKARIFFKTFREDLDQFTFCRECENRYIDGHTANVTTVTLNRKNG